MISIFISMLVEMSNLAAANALPTIAIVLGDGTGKLAVVDDGSGC